MDGRTDDVVGEYRFAVCTIPHLRSIVAANERWIVFVCRTRPQPAPLPPSSSPIVSGIIRSAISLFRRFYCCDFLSLIKIKNCILY